jgi:hypothetical protein
MLDLERARSLARYPTCHRGWVSDLFFQIPAKPSTTDCNVFLTAARRFHRAACRADPTPVRKPCNQALRVDP